MKNDYTFYKRQHMNYDSRPIPEPEENLFSDSFEHSPYKPKFKNSYNLTINNCVKKSDKLRNNEINRENEQFDR